MIAPPMTQTCEILETELNVFSDQEKTATIVSRCRFRWITELNASGGREEIRGDAFLWLPYDADVVEGTIVKVDDEYFRIERLIRARKLEGDQVQFLKCILRVQGGIEDAEGS